MIKKIVAERKWEDVDCLLEVLNLHHLERPKPFIHGKKCSNCDHRMHCKSIRCPLCHKEMRKRKRQGEENEIEVEENVNECDGECAKDLTGTEYHTLPCGHKFCYKCMECRVSSGWHTCCLCDSVFIPNAIKLKYGGVAITR